MEEKVLSYLKDKNGNPIGHCMIITDIENVGGWRCRIHCRKECSIEERTCEEHKHLLFIDEGQTQEEYWALWGTQD